MPPPYKPVGHCIYCPATRYSEDEPERKFGEEHIIPLQIRGALVLPEASCRNCEALTSGLESRITPLFNSGRYHLGIRGRKNRKARTHLPMEAEDGQRSEKIEIGRHPGTIFGFRFDFPNILLGVGPGGANVGRFQMAPVVPDFPERVKGLKKGLRFTIGKGVNAEDFRRVLAKIGHSFAVAELGSRGFEAMLIAAIDGSNPDHLPWLVGSDHSDEPKGTGPEHEIGFVNFHPDLIVIRIRLFATHGLAAHYVVAGLKFKGGATSV